MSVSAFLRTAALASVVAGIAVLSAQPVAAATDEDRPSHAAIASANAQATDAGMEVLAAGGNAFDAAVAVSATLGLVEPESSGLGGGGFMLLRIAESGREVFIDARERAPLAATRDMYLDADGDADRSRSVDGALAAAIPGLPAGLVHLSRDYGRLPLAQSLAPAIRLAREGWIFGSKNASMMGWRKDRLAADPGASELLLVDGEMPEVGTRMRNPAYADALELLVEQGEAGFYQGDLARRLVDGVRAAGGIWTLQDLAEYRVVERRPLQVEHRGWRIVTAPPPSSGGVAVAQILNVLDGYPYESLDGVDRVHLLVEAMRRAYRDRALYLGDPDHVEMPLDLLTSTQYAAGLRAAIHPAKATPSVLLPGVGDGSERADTTHFSLLDDAGNLVAVTQTVNLPYGNAFMVPDTGFLLNNQMDDFSVKAGVPNAFGLVGEDANAIEPGRRPLSSMTPSFLIGDERIAVIGTPGGSRIITMVLLGLLDLMAGEPAQAVVAAPRLHHQYLPDQISLEPGALDPQTVAGLSARGHDVQVLERRWGNMQVVLWNRGDGSVEAASDPRWEGVGKGTTGAADSGAIYR